MLPLCVLCLCTLPTPVPSAPHPARFALDIDRATVHCGYMTLNGTLALLIGKVALGASLALGFGIGPASAVPSDSTCMEDQPCWDCATMGNRQCGEEGWTIEADGIDYRCNFADGFDRVRCHPIGDLTYCPIDGVWSTEWHDCKGGE